MQDPCNTDICVICLHDNTLHALGSEMGHYKVAQISLGSIITMQLTGEMPLPKLIKNLCASHKELVNRGYDIFTRLSENEIREKKNT